VVIGQPGAGIDFFSTLMKNVIARSVFGDEAIC
jgi:hypothetical protein